MMTRSGWSVLAGSVLTIVAGRVFGLGELYVVGVTGLTLVVVALVQVRRRPPHLDVARTIRPGRVHLGGTSRVELQITNRATRRAPVLTLHDPVAGTIGATLSLAPLAPGEHRAATYRLPTRRRGLVDIGPLEARVTDAFGLAVRRSVVADEAALIVLPAVERLHLVAAGGRPDEPLAAVARPALATAGDEDFASLRPYVVGDDMRRVHWRSSARAGDLLVREDDPPWQGHLTIVLDAREDQLDAAGFEIAVSAAATLVHALTRRGDRARLVVTDGTDSSVADARTGRMTLLEHLALVERHRGGTLPGATLDRRPHTGGLVLITGTPDPGALAFLTTQRRRFAGVCLVVVDPSAVDGHDASPLPLLGPGVDLVVVAQGRTFAESWRAAAPGAGMRR